MSLPKDVDRVRVRILRDGVQRYGKTFHVDPAQSLRLQIPSTIAIVAGDDPNDTVEVQVVSTRSALTCAATPGAVLRIPINHFEGNYVCSPETLARLQQSFGYAGELELHGCQVGAGREGDALLRGLASALDVPVSASSSYQSPLLPLT